MNTDDRASLNQLSSKVIGAAQRVSSVLGCGLLEKVYENAMAIELRRLGLAVQQQRGIEVRYEQEIVGEYVADLVVNDRLIVELKAVSSVQPIHEAQCINYLRATQLPLCLLMNFSKPRLFVQRIING
jgi:GxxExxY protein